MQFLFTSFLDRHNRQLPDKTGPQLLFYLAFIHRFCEQYRIPFDKKWNLEGLLPRLFQPHVNLELLDAAQTLDAAMPWSTLQHDTDLCHAIYNLNQQLARSHCASPSWILKQMDLLFQAESSTAFSITPPSIRNLIAVLAAQHPTKTIFDICSGTFSLGFQVWQEMGSIPEITCIGEELNHYACAFSKVLLFLCGVSSFSIRERNVLDSSANEKHTEKGPSVYVADFPLSGNRVVPSPASVKRLDNGRPSIYADWFMIHQIFERMEANDRAFLLVTKGTLVRQHETFLRRQLLAQDWLDAVIHIPGGLSPSHPLPMELLICQKQRATYRQKAVFFADLHPHVVVNASRMTELSEEGIQIISNLYHHFYGETELARIVPTEEIQQHDHSLYPPVYLTKHPVSNHLLRLGDLATVIRGIQNTSVLPEQGEEYLLNIRDLQQGEICYQEAARTQILRSDWIQRYRIQEDDIILTCKGATLKLAIVLPNPPPAYISGNLTLIRTDPNRYPPYLLYEYLKSEQGLKALELIQTGTTIRVLGSKNLEDLLIPQYDIPSANTVGKELKYAAHQYHTALTELQQTYQARKEILWKQLQKGENL